jgi:hypothetical protein
MRSDPAQHARRSSTWLLVWEGEMGVSHNTGHSTTPLIGVLRGCGSSSKRRSERERKLFGKRRWSDSAQAEFEALTYYGLAYLRIFHEDPDER